MYLAEDNAVDHGETIAEAVEGLKRRDRTLAGLIERVGPCLLERGRPGITALVNSVVGQQLSNRAAGAIRTRLYALLGDGEIDPQRLAAVSEEDLRNTGMSWAKTRCLRGLAEHVLAGDIDFNAFDAEDDEAIVEQLTHVKGIGRWTAEMYLMFSMGRLDVFPVDDGSIRTAMRRVYRIPQAGFVAGARKKAERWRPFRSVASWYLYRYLDLPQEGG